MNDSIEPSDLNKAKLNLETARIPWSELQRYFAAGTVLAVSPGLDIVDVAYCMSIDDKPRIDAWLNEKALAQVSDDQAKQWFERDSELWAVVVRPWVLVQDRD